MLWFELFSPCRFQILRSMCLVPAIAFPGSWGTHVMVPAIAFLESWGARVSVWSLPLYFQEHMSWSLPLPFQDLEEHMSVSDPYIYRILRSKCRCLIPTFTGAYEPLSDPCHCIVFPACAIVWSLPLHCVSRIVLVFNSCIYKDLEEHVSVSNPRHCISRILRQCLVSGSWGVMV